MSSAKYTLIKLTNSNFGVWFQFLSAAFEGEDLDDLLLETTVKPEETADPRSAKDFKTRQGKAKSILFSALEPPDLEQVMLQPTIFKMVETLRNRFDRSISAYSIMDDIHRCHWSKTDTVDTFLNRLNKLRQQARDKSLNVDESLFVHKIVNQMPLFMRGLQTSYKVDLAKGTVLTYDSVCEAVKKFYDEVFDPNHPGSSHQSAQQNARQQPALSLVAQGYQQNSRSKKWCPLHKSRFHSKEECRRIKRLNELGNALPQNSHQPQLSNQQSNGSRNVAQEFATPVFVQPSTPQSTQINSPPLSNAPVQAVQPNPQPAAVAPSPDIEIPSVFGMTVLDHDADGRTLEWLFDSAASNVMSPFEDDFRDLQRTADGRTVTTANGPTQVQGTGDIHITSFNGEQHLKMSFRKAYYVPSLPARLFSEPLARKAGLSVCTDPAAGLLRLNNSKGQTIFTGSAAPFTDEIFKMNINVVKPLVGALVSFTEAHLHGSWGHCPPKVIHQTIENDLVCDIRVTDCDHDCSCEVCIQAVTQCKPHRGELIKSKIPGQVIHCDSYTPNLKSYGQLGTAFVFVDEATGYKCVMLAKDKTFPRVKAAFAAYLTFQKRVLGSKPIEFHADSGTEFTSQSLKLFLNERNISVSHSTPYHKQQNGVAEAAMKQLINTTTALLLSSNLPVFLWNRLFVTAAKLINIRYKRSIETSPYKAFHGQSAIVSHFRPIGTRAHAHVPGEKRHAFQPRTQTVFLLDYTDSQSLFIMYNPRSKQVEQHFKPTFIENSTPVYKATASARLPARPAQNPESAVGRPAKPPAEQPAYKTVEIEFEPAVLPYLPSSYPSFQLPEPDDERQSDPGEGSNDPPDPDDPLTLARCLFDPEPEESVDRPKRKYDKRNYEKVHRNLRSNSASNSSSALVATFPDDQLDDIWDQPRIEEMQSQISNGTWVLEHPPPGANIIRCDFVYGHKLDPITRQLRRKARLVAKGYAQRYGIDFFETYAPTMAGVSLKIVLGLIIRLDLATIQFDVKTAFLHSRLKEVIYMTQPPHFNDGTGRVCRLLKSIYGLKQAARDWYAELKSTLTHFGFSVLDSEQCVFLYTKSEVFTIIGLYVDDGLAASNTPSELDRLIAYLSTKYTMKVGPLTKFIGLEVERTNGKFYLHQRQYIEKALAIYGMTNCRPISTPAPKGYPISHNDLYDPAIHSTFRSMVASLQYLARTSRPDIAFIVGALSTKLECPSAADLGSAKRILRYLSTTVGLAIEFRKSGELSLIGFCDANFGVEPRGLSRTGAILELFGNPIGWWSKLQPLPARSSTEAEWYAIDFVLRECLPVKRHLEDLAFKIHRFTICSDNQSAIAICADEKGKTNPRTKHVERCYYYVRHYVENQQLELRYLSTDHQPADLLTKSLAREQHYRLVAALHLTSMP